MYRRACAENEEVSDLYKVARQDKETWMLFLESTFSLVLCTFHQFNRNFSESAKFSWNMCVCVCVCVCVCARARALSTQFHDRAFKLNINWPSAIILSTFTWKYERKYDFRL
jgi:hypothetical protein